MSSPRRTPTANGHLPKRNDATTSSERWGKKDANGRSKSDRRPARYRNWDNPPMNRRAFSLNLKAERHSFDITGTKESVNVLRNVISLTREELASKRLEIKYSSRLDQYRRPTDPSFLKIKGWKSLVYAERNMELVTEHRQMGDGEKVMVYLSRNPGSNSSCMQWKFDFTETGLSVERFNLRFSYDTSEDGSVKVYLKPDFRGYNEPPEDPPEKIVLWSIPTIRSIPEAQGNEYGAALSVQVSYPSAKTVISRIKRSRSSATVIVQKNQEFEMRANVLKALDAVKKIR